MIVVMTFNFHVDGSDFSNYEVSEFDTMEEYLNSDIRSYQTTFSQPSHYGDEVELISQGYHFRSRWEDCSTSQKRFYMVTDVGEVGGTTINLKSTNTDLKTVGKFLQEKVLQYKRDKKLTSIL